MYDPAGEPLVVLTDSWESWPDGSSAGVVTIDLTGRRTVLPEPSETQHAP